MLGPVDHFSDMENLVFYKALSLKIKVSNTEQKCSYYLCQYQHIETPKASRTVYLSNIRTIQLYQFIGLQRCDILISFLKNIDTELLLTFLVGRWNSSSIQCNLMFYFDVICLSKIHLVNWTQHLRLWHIKSIICPEKKETFALMEIANCIFAKKI